MNTHFPVFTLYSLNVSSPPAVTRVSPRSSNDSPVICIGDDCLLLDDSACAASTALEKTLDGLKRLCEYHINHFSCAKKVKYTIIGPVRTSEGVPLAAEFPGGWVMLQVATSSLPPRRPCPRYL